MLLEEGGKEEACGHIEDARGLVIEIVCKWSIVGRYVKVSVQYDPLTLCEVEVMGVKGSYLLFL